MKYVFVLPLLLASLTLGACNTQSPTPSAFSVTPEPGGAPAFTQPTVVVNVEPGAEGTATYPGPASADSTAYPGPQPAQSTGSADGRTGTALEGYELALATAQQNYSPDVQLYGIVPSSIMSRNLGGLPTVPGWFYKFKNPGERREFIVQVVDGQVNGTTMAEAIEEPTPKELPIDLSQVKLDSTQVLEQFTTYAAENNIPTEGVTFDLELANLEGAAGPTWSVVDPDERRWLYSISAANGNTVPNPHG
jgi:hypothetical protein